MSVTTIDKFTPRPHGHEDHIHPEPEGFIRKYIFTIDHKIIGLQYMVTGLLFFVIAGVLLTFIVGMPSMVRTRFSTPTIGREWMIGSMGSAVGAISPEGVAQVGEAKWRARTNRATPIEAGGELRVVAIDGVTLEVEPAEGGARDYRERRPKTDVAEIAADDAEAR